MTATKTVLNLLATFSLIFFLLWPSNESATTAILADYKHSWLNIRSDNAPLWCGKAYLPEYAAVDPGGRAAVPAKSDETILDFQCFTRTNAYFHGEDQAEVIFKIRPVDVLLPRAHVDTRHIPATSQKLSITVAGQSRDIALSEALLYKFNVSLSNYDPSVIAHRIECSVTNDEIVIQRSAELYHLPHRPYPGSFSKLDQLTGLIMLNSTAQGAPTAWTPFYPYGFYGQPKNLADLAEQGFNILHYIPDVSSAPNMGYPENYFAMLQEAANLGIWVMHDMRWTWQDQALLSHQVNLHKEVTNLLTWYIGDEPDGATDDPEVFRARLQTVRSIDSRYRVISTALNCADFFFERYSKDIDVLLTDPYPVGLSSAQFGKSIYGTVCNATYGCCGCDNCPTSSVMDVRTRIQSVEDKLYHLGRRSAIWVVPQAFGAAEHWTRIPTEQESSAMQILALGLTHGAVAWNYQPEVDGPDNELTDDACAKKTQILDLRRITSAMARLTTNSQMIMSQDSYKSFDLEGIYCQTWSNSSHSLVGLVSNGTTIGSSLIPVEVGEADSLNLLIGASHFSILDKILHYHPTGTLDASVLLIEHVLPRSVRI